MMMTMMMMMILLVNGLDIFIPDIIKLTVKGHTYLGRNASIITKTYLFTYSANILLESITYFTQHMH